MFVVILYFDIPAVIFTVHPQAFDWMMSAIPAFTPMEFGLVGLITSTRTSLSKKEVSCHSVSALSSICKLPPGSIIPSRIVAELSHTLFDLISICTQCRIQLCGSCSSQQFQHVLFDLVEPSRTTRNAELYRRRFPEFNNVELHRPTVRSPA